VTVKLKQFFSLKETLKMNGWSDGQNGCY